MKTETTDRLSWLVPTLLSVLAVIFTAGIAWGESSNTNSNQDSRLDRIEQRLDDIYSLLGGTND
jgi:hypothetical protein